MFIDFLPSRDRASIVQTITDPRTNSKATTTLTVTWGGDKRRASAGCSGSESQTMGEVTPESGKVTEGELPSLSKFREETVPVSELKLEDDETLKKSTPGALGRSSEGQPRRNSGSSTDRRSMNIKVKDGGDINSVDASHQVLVYDMRKP